MRSPLGLCCLLHLGRSQNIPLQVQSHHDLVADDEDKDIQTMRCPGYHSVTAILMSIRLDGLPIDRISVDVTHCNHSASRNTRLAGYIALMWLSPAIDHPTRHTYGNSFVLQRAVLRGCGEIDSCMENRSSNLYSICMLACSIMALAENSRTWF